MCLFLFLFCKRLYLEGIHLFVISIHNPNDHDQNLNTTCISIIPFHPIPSRSMLSLIHAVVMPSLRLYSCFFFCLCLFGFFFFFLLWIIHRTYLQNTLTTLSQHSHFTLHVHTHDVKHSLIKLSSSPHTHISFVLFPFLFLSFPSSSFFLFALSNSKCRLF